MHRNYYIYCTVPRRSAGLITSDLQGCTEHSTAYTPSAGPRVARAEIHDDVASAVVVVDPERDQELLATLAAEAQRIRGAAPVDMQRAGVAGVGPDAPIGILVPHDFLDDVKVCILVPIEDTWIL